MEHATYKGGVGSVPATGRGCSVSFFSDGDSLEALLQSQARIPTSSLSGSSLVGQDVSGDDRQGSYAEAGALLVLSPNDAAENGEPQELSDQ